MEKKPSQNNTEINDTRTNSFGNAPADVIVTILPFLGLQDMGKLSRVDKRFHEIVRNAFTNPNIYTAYPGIFEALCKFWYENPVAFQKWFKLYRIDTIQKTPHGVNQYSQACDYIFNAFQPTDGSVNRDKLNNDLEIVFQNSANDITQFLLPLVSNANQLALYRTFGNTRLQKSLEAQIRKWTTKTESSKEQIHTLLFCLLTSRDIKFFTGKHQVLINMLDYAEKNMNEIFGQEAIKKYGEGFIKALIQSCRLTLDAANGTKPTAEKINAIRKDFPNAPINLAGANLRSANLWETKLNGADLRYADLRYAHLTGAHLRGANLFVCAFAPYTKSEGIKIDSTALLSVFIPNINDPQATTNIWSLNNKTIDTFKRLLPHADIKELELLMECVKKRISVNRMDFIFGQLKKAELLKLISNEIAKKQAQQKIECKEQTQEAASSGNAQQQNPSAINSTLESQEQSEDTIGFNPELKGQDENQEINLEGSSGSLRSSS